MKWMSAVYVATLLWMAGNTRPSPLIFAHRGARSLAPENTGAAARVAARLGAHGWEFDVRLTKDGELVLMHDETLTRTTDAEDLFPTRKPWKVADFTYEEIRQLDAGSWFLEQDPFGTLGSGELSWEEAARYRGEKVPSLREALLLSRELGLLVNIEIKPAFSPLVFTDADKTAASKTVATVRELRMTEEVLISSFSPEIVRYVKRLAPEMKVALLVGEPVPNLDTLLKELGADALNPFYRLFSREDLCRFHRQGYEIYLWTVNDPDDIARFCADPCVTGIITDWPQRVSSR